MKYIILFPLFLAATAFGLYVDSEPGNLMYAAQEGDLDTVRLYVNRFGNVNLKIGGYSALMLSVSKEHEQVARFLLDHRANVEDANSIGCTQICIATLRGNMKMVKLLLNYNPNLEHETDLHGWTPLNIAVQNGREDLVKLLLENSANVHHKIRTGETPLEQSINAGFRRIVKLLLDHGANVYQKTAKGATLLELAIEKGNNDIVKMLRDYTGTS